jgi:hypothetical protein
MSAKYYAAWIFGRFLRYSGYPPRPPIASVRWHVLSNSRYTWCGLETIEGEIRAWDLGPPDGPVCQSCIQYFERTVGLSPLKVSAVVAGQKQG